MTTARQIAEETFISIVEKIRCPDYGEHRETDAYAEFRRESIEILEAALTQMRSDTLREAAEKVKDFPWVLPVFESPELNDATDDAACEVANQIHAFILSLAGPEKK